MPDGKKPGAYVVRNVTTERVRPLGSQPSTEPTEDPSDEAAVPPVGARSQPVNPSIPNAPALPTLPRQPSLREEYVAPHSLVPKRATSMPPSGPGPSVQERAARALEQLSSCGPDDEGHAVQLLVSLGAEGLKAVESTFPGLLWFHRSLSHSAVPRGRDCGPSCRVIAAFGDEAIPTLLRLLSRPGEPRYYAVLLVRDLLGTTDARGARVLVDALLKYSIDDDRDVARESQATLTAIRPSPVLTAQAGALCARATDPSNDTQARAGALQILATLRWPALVPTCIDLVDDFDASIQALARGALRLMTASPPRSRLQWKRWWDKNAAVPRSEWLIRGLGTRDKAIRATAHAELQALVGAETVNYSPSMGWWSRRRAQHAFRAAVAARTNA